MSIGTISSIGKKEDAGGSSKLYLIQFEGANSPIVSFYSTVPLTNYKELYDYLKARFPNSNKNLNMLLQGKIKTTNDSKTCHYTHGVFVHLDYILVGAYLYENATFKSTQFHIYETTSNFHIRCIEM